MSDGANEIDFSTTGNKPLNKEGLDDQTVRTLIPESLMEIIRNSGTNPNEVKGMYLSPKHSLNPFPGKHFIGENPISSIEFDTKLILKQETVLLSEELDVDVKAVAASFAERLDSLTMDGLPSDWTETSKKSILKHEETHRDQNVRFQYLETFEEAAKTMMKIRDRIEDSSNPQIETTFDDLNRAYKIAFVQTEVQALIRGLDYFDDLSMNNLNNKAVKEGFAYYWTGKVFSLFTKYEGNIRSRTMFDEIFFRIKENKMMFEDLDNGINQLARMIMLVGNNNLISEIESGTVSKDEVKRKIVEGLANFVEDPSGYITKVITKGLEEDKHIYDALANLRNELQKAKGSIGIQQ